MKSLELLPIILAFGVAFGAMAQVPSLISYQGRLSAGSTNVFNGPGQFKFALVNGGMDLNHQAKATATVSGGFLTLITVTDPGSGYLETPKVTITDLTGSNAVATATMSGGSVTAINVSSPGRHYSDTPKVAIAAPPPNFVYGTYWSNDGTSTGGNEPSQAIPLLVNQGLFAANLGDTGISNMTDVVPPSIFTNSDVRLRIWFSDGVSGFQQFYPDQRLTSVGYAMMAGNVVDGAITSTKLASGAVGINALAANSVSTANIADGAITSDKLTDGAVTGSKLALGAVPWVPNAIAVFTSSGNFINPRGPTPNDVLRAYVKLWGGGGAGLIIDGTQFTGSGGGYCEGFVTFAGNQTVTVGSGGTGAGASGGDSSFLSLTAGGGGGGRSGSGGGSASGGSLNLAGGSGDGNFGGDSPFGGRGGTVGSLNGRFPGGGGGAYSSFGAGAGGMVIVYY